MLLIPWLLTAVRGAVLFTILIVISNSIFGPGAISWYVLLFGIPIHVVGDFAGFLDTILHESRKSFPVGVCFTVLIGLTIGCTVVFGAYAGALVFAESIYAFRHGTVRAVASLLSLGLSSSDDLNNPTGKKLTDIFPEVIGEWTRATIREYGPSLGFSVAYKLPNDATATLYFYDDGNIWITPGADSPKVQEQFEQAKSDVLAANVQGIWRELKHIGDDVVSFGAGSSSPQALRATFRGVNLGGREIYTQILLASEKNQFIKVRLSFPAKIDLSVDWQESVSLILSWLGKAAHEHVALAQRLAATQSN
jgi:hypothetical protein